MARIHEVVENLFGTSVSEDDILEAFRLEHPGFRSHPMTHELDGAIIVHGDFNTSSADCSYAGTFERRLYRAGNTLAAHHMNIEVAKAFRKQKIASSHLAKAVRFYDSVGVEYVHLQAVGYGPIVWPQLGFEVHEKSDVKLLNREFRSLMAELGYEAEPPARTPALALLPPVEGVPVGLEALDRLYRSLALKPIPMILDLGDAETRAFLVNRGILEATKGERS